jgi:hypothetical protein
MIFIDIIQRKLEDGLTEELKIVESIPISTDRSDITIRTATSGIIHRLLVFLTLVAFVGNGFFMIYVFWLSK